mgnify:CR=1 FL=1
MLSFLRDRKVRDVLWQAAGALALIALVWFFVRNASENMVKAGIASGFQFLGRDSGIEVPFNLTGYKPSDTILALLWTGIVNTLLVSAVSIVVATVIGFSVGLLRLSRNWLLSTLAGFYIEFVRNIPLLFFVLFWYFGVLAALPTPRDSVNFLDVANSYNAQLRLRKISESVLDEFPGIGAARKQALLKKFGSIHRLRLATVEQIAELPGIGSKSAEELKAFLETRSERPPSAQTS